MALAIWPVSPLPAGLDRNPFWKIDETFYDSGAYQGMTTFQRPLYRYGIPFKNFNEVKQATLISFFNQQRRGGNTPFLMKDPYDYRVNSVRASSAGITTGTLSLFDTNSFFVRADTTTIGSLFSSVSGYVRLGIEYNYDQDSGVLTIVAKDVLDDWSVRSMEYFRKCVFFGDYNEQATIWQIFNANVQLREIV